MQQRNVAPDSVNSIEAMKASAVLHTKLTLVQKQAEQ